MLIKWLNNINMRLNMKIKASKNHTNEELFSYIQQFKEPKDDFQRAYFQYKCSCFLYEKGLILFAKNIVSFLLILYFIYVKCRKKPEKQKTCRYVFVYDGDRTDMIPDKYLKDMQKFDIGHDIYLGHEDRIFIRKLWRRYPFSCFFVFKCLVKIATYRAAIETYHPKDILCSCENSYTSAILTMYCEQKGMKHINVMHGVTGLAGSVAFHRFSIFNVWCDADIETYRMLRAGTKTYEIGIPKCMRFNVRREAEEQGRYVYYMQNTGEEILDRLKELWQILKSRGITVILRPHPVYTNIHAVKQCLPEAELEDTKAINIEDSINRAECVLARTSTVLWQAQIMGKKVLIDDVSLPGEYEAARERRVFVWRDSARLLSDFLKETDAIENTDI